MHLLLFDHPNIVTQQELRNDLLLLPQWRQRKVLSYHFLIDRVLCAKAYLLLKQGLHDFYGISGNPDFEYLAHGKPVLKDFPDIHFNLSHCRKGVLCVIDEKPVGCDIEEIVPSIEPGLSGLCLNAEEIAAVATAENPCIEFTKLWTQKEAVLKLTGEGINDDLPSLFTPDTLKNLSLHTEVCQSKGFVYSVCQRKD